MPDGGTEGGCRRLAGRFISALGRCQAERTLAAQLLSQLRVPVPPSQGGYAAGLGTAISTLFIGVMALAISRQRT